MEGSKRNSSTTLDWTDVLTFVHEIERTHFCKVGLVMVEEELGYVRQWRVDLQAMRLNPLTVLGVPIVGVTSYWPNSGFKTLEGLAYKLAVEIDHELTTNGWEQSEMKF